MSGLAASSAVAADIVLLHGWGAHAGFWTDVSSALGPRHRLHAVDLPGHGQARPAVEGAFAQLPDALARSMPATVGVVGWSLGGQIALEWAAAAPRQVRWLVLVATTPCFVERPDWPEGMAAAVFDPFAKGLVQDCESTLNRFAALHVAGARDAHATRVRLRELIASTPAPLPSALTQGLDWLRTQDLRSRLGAVRAPATVLHGTADRIVPIGAGQRLAALLPRARYIEIEGAGHALLLSHPERIAQAIRDAANEL